MSRSLYLTVSLLLSSAFLSNLALAETSQKTAVNPWLNDSVYPISHHNPAQTDTSVVTGPSIGKALTEADATSVIATWVSNPTIKTIVSDDGIREQIVIASNPHNIMKLRATGEAFEVISKEPYPGQEKLFKHSSDDDILNAMKRIDKYRLNKNDFMLSLSSLWTYVDLKLTPATMGSGAYSLIDKDGYHYTAFDLTHVVKSFDNNDVNAPMKPVAHVNVRDLLPKNIAKTLDGILGINITSDGHLLFAASGMMFVLNRNLELLDYKLFPGELVENSIAVDESNGIYMVTSKQMHKLVWTGDKLSRNAADGAWSSDYDIASTPIQGALSVGSGTTPSLIGFGDKADKLVAISDHNENGSNLVVFWRDEIPEDFTQKPGTASRRIADQHKIAVSKATIEASFLTFGDGIVIVNTSYPEPAWVGKDALGNGMLAGTTREAPLGVEKFVWNSERRQLKSVWIRDDIDGSDWMPPTISPSNNLIYVANKENDIYEYDALNWYTGETVARWTFPNNSIRWGNWGGITTLMEDGDLLVGGFFAFTRYNIGHLRPTPEIKKSAVTN